MRINLALGGILEPGALDAWALKKREQLRKGAARGLREGGRAALPAFRHAIAAAFAGNKLPRSVSMRLYDRDRTRMPALLIRSQVPWLGIHEHGGTIRGPLLIPLARGVRMSAKRFRAIVTALLRSGNAFFKKIGANTFLFAENLRENASELRRFKGVDLAVGRGKRRLEMPIAMLVPQVTLKKRLHWARTGHTVAPAIARAVMANALKG